jgi:glycosyltransferase involved in cell wall biosynthesis
MRLLTVGLPVYNSMPFLPETVNSLLQQTYTDFEFLIIDDGSTDGSGDYLRSLKDPRIRLLSQENQGLSATLNRMLREARTPWLVRHDGDDVAFPNRLNLTLNHVERFPDAGMFYSYARYYQDGRVHGNFRTTTGTPEGLREITRRGFLLAICHPTVTLNVEKTIRLGGYRFNLHVEDIDLWWRMALQYNIRLIPEATIAFRHNLTSISAKNLEQQSVNTLYIQYLLLSHVWGLTPMTYASAAPLLGSLVNRRKLRFRENARMANVYFSRRDYPLALRYSCASLMSSPSHFFSRALYELRSKAAVTNGVAPELFRKRRQLFWPGETHTRTAQLACESQ